MSASEAKQLFAAGLASHGIGDLESALRSFEAALQLAPDRESIWLNLISVNLDLNRVGNAAERIAAFEQSNAFQRSYTYLSCKAGIAFKQAHFEEAATLFLEACSICSDPRDASRLLYYCYLAKIQIESRENLEKALLSSETRAHLGEDFCLELLARVALKFSDYPLAMKLLKTGPQSGNFPALMLDTLIGLGDFEEAVGVLNGNPSMNVPTGKILLINRNAGTPREDEQVLIKQLEDSPQELEKCDPITLRFFSDNPAALLRSTNFFGSKLFTRSTTGRLASSSALKRSSMMRVGFMSADLRDHAVGYLIHDLLVELQGCIDLFVFHLNPPDESFVFNSLRRHLKNFVYFDYFASSEQLADRLAKYHLDFIIDLGGFTKYSRPDVFALAPGPIRINYLGYPGESLQSIHDFTISDEVISPLSSSSGDAQIVRLPLCYQIVSPSFLFRRPPTLLPIKCGQDMVVLSNPNKIGVHSLYLWARVMEQSPGRNLVLLSPSHSYGVQLSRFPCLFPLRERLRFIQTCPHGEHLERIDRFSVVLDSFPYGSHTTCSDVMARSTPIVTKIGRGFQSRVCASVLTALGLEELIAETDDEYINIALKLIEDQSYYQAVIEKIVASRDSDFFNLPKRSASFVNLLRGIG